MNGFILADIEGLQLTAADTEILSHPYIGGVVLFSRNYSDPTQLKALTEKLTLIKPNFIVAVDQEGGRVQRFRSHFTALPSMRHWGQLYRENPEAGSAELAQTIEQMAAELKSVGINFDLLPVLDLDRKLNSVIGERSFSRDPVVVKQLAEILIETMHRNKMPVIGKHFPGHGGVSADSHEDLPVDVRPLEQIEQDDLLPFVQLKHKLDAIMPAHVVYKDIDSLPTTYSSYWLQDYLRQKMQYAGVVISDDLTMAGAAEMGSYTDRAFAALSAGCDILTVCNNREGVVAILDQKNLKPSALGDDRITTFLAKLKGV